ncbi:MAG: sigma-70 family RNA polymerase sigma factor [Pirellulaceae bacterium]|nr:sigma-70 family RNA polymerase sigma factor [Pirellulaceae bacterium]
MNEDLSAIQQVLHGDSQAFRLLVERHQDTVVRFAFTFLSRHDAAEDVAQDVFLAAFRKLDSYDATQAAFVTWLLTITRNRCLNRLKRNRNEVVTESPEPTFMRTPVDMAGEREFFEQLDAALRKLPVEQRTAFVLAEIEGLPYEQIGSLEHVAVGTVKSRVHRAKQRLRRLLKDVVEQMP